MIGAIIGSGFQHDFPKWESLVGHTEWSRFGFSLAAAGDLNQDGFNGDKLPILLLVGIQRNFSWKREVDQTREYS